MSINKLFRGTSSWSGILGCLGLCAAQGASLPAARVVAPTVLARITESNYCFARVRRLMPERQPPSYLVLQLRIQLAYHNAGTRPLIIPMGHERTIYTALKPGVMKIFNDLPIFSEIEPTLKMMKELPLKVNPDNPVDPQNEYFAILPAGGDLVLPTSEEVTFPVEDHRLLLRHDPDLRGHTLYVRLKMRQQELSPALETDLSDRWTRFGVPWTGNMLSNVVTIDVPKVPPQSPPCVDHQVGTPARNLDSGK